MRILSFRHNEPERQLCKFGLGVVSRVWWKFEDGVISGCIEATQPAAGTAKEITP